MKIAVAMSGGVDSSLAAALLIEEGHEVFGVTMRLAAPLSAEQLSPSEAEVGSEAKLESPREAADRLGIPLVEVDLGEAFAELVLEPFVSSYARGLTPSPCVSCNRLLKFGALWEVCRSLGAERMASGHYARILRDGRGGLRLKRGVDGHKDQSYFLFQVGEEQLARTLFPLGEWTKERVREAARARGLPASSRPDSQDLCFLNGAHYLDYLEQVLSEQQLTSGEIVHAVSGESLGVHGGVHRFTIGQRRRLCVSSSDGRLYVVSIEAGGRVLVGPKSELATRECILRDCVWYSGLESGSRLAGFVQIRYRHKPVWATVELLGNKQARLSFEPPELAVAPGQAAVVYNQDDEVLGGGFIDTTIRSSS